MLTPEEKNGEKNAWPESRNGKKIVRGRILLMMIRC